MISLKREDNAAAQRERFSATGDDNQTRKSPTTKEEVAAAQRERFSATGDDNQTRKSPTPKEDDGAAQRERFSATGDDNQTRKSPTPKEDDGAAQREQFSATGDDNQTRKSPTPKEEVGCRAMEQFSTALPVWFTSLPVSEALKSGRRNSELHRPLEQPITNRSNSCPIPGNQSIGENDSSGGSRSSPSSRIVSEPQSPQSQESTPADDKEQPAAPLLPISRDNDEQGESARSNTQESPQDPPSALLPSLSDAVHKEDDKWEEFSSSHPEWFLPLPKNKAIEFPKEVVEIFGVNISNPPICDLSEKRIRDIEASN